MYTGPLDSEVVDSMNDCDPEVRHVISRMKSIEYLFYRTRKT